MSFKSNKMIERGVSAKSVVSSLTRNDDVGTVIAMYKEDKIQEEHSHSNEVFSYFSKAKLNKTMSGRQSAKSFKNLSDAKLSTTKIVRPKSGKETSTKNVKIINLLKTQNVSSIETSKMPKVSEDFSRKQEFYRTGDRAHVISGDGTPQPMDRNTSPLPDLRKWPTQTQIKQQKL